MSKAPVYHCGGQHHLIGQCRFHLASFVGNYMVSTVGEYRPDGKDMVTIGLGDESFYETYVFPTDGNLPHPDITDWCELDGERWATHEAANEGHARYVAKYRRRVLRELRA